jgi:hypothetical protein
LKVDLALDSIRAHYTEMPGLSLTPAQVRRLCGLDELDGAVGEQLPDRLVKEGVLQRSPDGRYRKAA